MFDTPTVSLPGIPHCVEASDAVWDPWEGKRGEASDAVWDPWAGSVRRSVGSRYVDGRARGLEVGHREEDGMMVEVGVGR